MNAREKIEQKLRIAEKATKGPWEFQDMHSNQFVNAVIDAEIIKPICALPSLSPKDDDFEFIAATRDGKADYEQLLRSWLILDAALESIALEPRMSGSLDKYAETIANDTAIARKARTQAHKIVGE